MTALQKGIEIALGIHGYFSMAIEAGVYKGHTLTTIAEAWAGKGRVIGFDSFEGLPHDWPNTVCKKGQFSLGGVIPQEPLEAGAEIYLGWFEKTLPEFAKTLKSDKKIALLHLDCDLYSSTETVLKALNDYICPGTVIVCDEWTYNFAERRTDQEQQAVRDWATQYNREFVMHWYEDPTVDPDSRLHVGMERAILIVTK